MEYLFLSDEILKRIDNIEANKNIEEYDSFEDLFNDLEI